MRTLEELINKEDPGWPVVQEWIEKAKNKIEVLPCEKSKAEETLLHTQVTTRSLMGAVIYETGGLLVDNGWIRILGSGSEKMKRSLDEWNRGKTFSEYGEPAPYLLVADDAIGGDFMRSMGGDFSEKMRGGIYIILLPIWCNGFQWKWVIASSFSFASKQIWMNFIRICDGKDGKMR